MIGHLYQRQHLHRRNASHMERIMVSETYDFLLVFWFCVALASRASTILQYKAEDHEEFGVTNDGSFIFIPLRRMNDRIIIILLL